MPGGFSNGFSNGFDVYSFNILTTSLPHIIYNIPYSEYYLADEDNAEWALISGVLPSGLTLNASGLQSGTTTDTGMFNITIRATSSLTSDTDEEIYSFDVASTDGFIRRRIQATWNNFRLIKRI